MIEFSIIYFQILELTKESKIEVKFIICFLKNLSFIAIIRNFLAFWLCSHSTQYLIEIIISKDVFTIRISKLYQTVLFKSNTQKISIVIWFAKKDLGSSNSYL